MSERVLVIAEAGVNHNGSLDLALRLVRAAAEAGADAVKFQSFHADALATPDAVKAAYQLADGVPGESQTEMLRRLELPAGGAERLAEECAEAGVEFLSSPFDLESADALAALGMGRFKVASGEITNLPLLERIASFGRPVLLSTGMADLGEIEDALRVLLGAGLAREQVTVLQCTTHYPIEPADANLRAMVTIRDAFKVAVGYSDHTRGVDVPLGAVALGASVLEKHLTLDRSLPGPDHAASLEPVELALMVRGIRAVESSLGDGVKAPLPIEADILPIARKSIVAARDIAEGEVLTADALTTKRPGTGLSPMRWYDVVGSPARRAYAKDELIEQ